VAEQGRLNRSWRQQGQAQKGDRVRACVAGKMHGSHTAEVGRCGMVVQLLEK
jgi:hypothetical protein